VEAGRRRPEAGSHARPFEGCPRVVVGAKRSILSSFGKKCPGFPQNLPQKLTFDRPSKGLARTGGGEKKTAWSRKWLQERGRDTPTTGLAWPIRGSVKSQFRQSQKSILTDPRRALSGQEAGRRRQLLAIYAHKMAPRTGHRLQERGWDTPTKGRSWRRGEEESLVQERREQVVRFHHLQGYLAHKKLPPPRTLQ